MPVLLAAYQWNRDNVQYAKPAVVDQVNTWYSEGGYYFKVKFDGQYVTGVVDPPGYASVTRCGQTFTIRNGDPMYRLEYSSSATICGEGFVQYFVNATYYMQEVDIRWSQFRGVGGVNPSAPPTQDEANLWAQTQIDGGHWADVVKPALDAVIRAAVTWDDLAALGGNSNEPGIDREPKVIAIDPGHGRNCPKQTWRGATGPTGLREAEVVFDIAQRVKANLEARGYTVIQTRLDDCYIAEQTRLDRANQGGAAIFVSIHLNAHEDESFNWTEVWVDAEVTLTRTQSESLAGRVAQDQAPLVQNPNPVIRRMSTWSGGSGILGVLYSGHDDPWEPKKIYVLKHASDTRLLPAALSEVAHLSNLTQETAFRDSAYLQQVAVAISGAITQFFGQP